MRAMFRLHPFLTSLFAGASLAALVFLVNFIMGIVGWDGGRPGPVRPWMTVGLVAQNWDLDPRAIDAAAGLPLPVDGRPFTLQEIADDRGVPVADIIALVEQTVRDMRRAQGHGKAHGLGDQTE
jgi:hypothetical protein